MVKKWNMLSVTEGILFWYYLTAHSLDHHEIWKKSANDWAYCVLTNQVPLIPPIFLGFRRMGFKCNPDLQHKFREDEKSKS